MSRRLSIAFLILFTVWLRGPSVTQGLPYFYNEDEAHHFNRVVNMVKSGDLDPHYFHKPSLHFYLRMPVVALSFFWNVSEGKIRSIKEIVTSDEEGTAGYSFSASHPSIVTWNRAFSLLFGVGVVLLVFFTLELVSNESMFPLAGGLLTALSPALLEEGAVIGVDVVMNFFCLLATYLCVKGLRDNNYKFLFYGALASGLAISTKYNAFPIASVPFVAGLLFHNEENTCRITTVLKLVGISIAGFFLGSPYILKEIPLFLDQFAYEIWHYKIAGHEGHTGEPGSAQLLFYSKWLGREAIGYVAFALSLLGLAVTAKHKSRLALVIAVFPLLFTLLMIGQKVNFTRNMLVIIPYTVIFALLFVAALARSKLVRTILLIAIFIQPLFKAFTVRSEMRRVEESRLVLEDQLKKDPQAEKAVSSVLECASSCFQYQGVGEVTKNLSPMAIYMDGFDYYAAPERIHGEPFMEVVSHISGAKEEQRIVKNPAITFWKFNPEKIVTEQKLAFLASTEAHPIVMEKSERGFSCTKEEACWVTQRLTKIFVHDLTSDSKFYGRDGLVPFEFTVFTPWQNQGGSITFDDFLAFIDLPKIAGGKEERFTLNMPYQELKSQGYFILSLSDIHSPKSQGVGNDPRRLGLQIKNIRIMQR